MDGRSLQDRRTVQTEFDVQEVIRVIYYLSGAPLGRRYDPDRPCQNVKRFL